MAKFIGRQAELSQLKQLSDKKTASLVVLKGRRRIGKSRLLEEFANHFEKAYVFSGLPPRKGISAELQRREFNEQFYRQSGKRFEQRDDWGHLFWQLSKVAETGQILIILDEITWMGSMDPDFLGKLKNAWDLYFKKNDQLMLVLCGSVSAWIEKNILSSTGFLGRTSLVLTLEEMPLNDCAKFWDDNDQRVSSYEKLKLFSVTGGIPRYLESINTKLTAEQNIQQLCFEESGILFEEFEKIFSDLFNSKNQLYKNIVNCLSHGIADQEKILHSIKLKKNGDISTYLNDLINAGFISRDLTWQIKNGRMSKLSHYRLKDNYSRFYLKYIMPNKAKIKLGNMKNISLSSLKNWHAMMGLQVENLVLSNRNFIKRKLQINPNDIIADNPFFQRKSTKQAGCQIDYMIQTKDNVLYFFEIKFSSKAVDKSIIKEMQDKISCVKIPRQFSYRPILIHTNGVSESVIDSQYFSNIINFSECLCDPSVIGTV